MSKAPINGRVTVLFEYNNQGLVEFLNVTNCEIFWSLDAGIVMKTAEIQGVENPQSKRLLVELNEVNKMLVYLYIDGKLFIKSFITEGMLKWNLSKNGLMFKFTILDRFMPLKISDIIKTKPEAGMPLQVFLANCLSELGFDVKNFSDSYNRKISKASDFIKNGYGIENFIKLKTFKKDDFLSDEGRDLVSQCLALSRVLLISDGIDTLTLEEPNANPFPIYNIDYETDPNISYIGSQSESSQTDISPRAVVLLNSYSENGEQTSPVLVDNSFGYPNYFQVKQVSYKATSQELRSMINYGFADIKTRQNSFFISLSNKLFDNNGDFFQPNRKISVYCKKLGFQHNLTLLAMSATIDKNGTELKLNISSEGAFEDNASLRQKLSLM